MKKLFEIFKHPGAEFRGKPFWAWNGKLEPQELRRQIRIMHAMGLGGFFMHSRVGLDIPYLSDEWFRCINACIDEAKKHNMEAWLYDEDRWPSGAAGGIVTKNPKYRMRSLVVEVMKNGRKLKWDRNTLAVFAARVSGATAACVRNVPRGGRVSSLGKGESLLVFRKKIHECSSWYNGFSYLDTLNHDAVKQFISVTHDAYRKNCGKYFGTVIPGIFTDEPNYGAAEGEDSVPWTDKLPVVFRERYGYDILKHLVELFFDVDGEPVTRARYHYHDCITHLFVDAFARQIGQWCDKNNVMHTGHVLAEQTLSSQTSVVGSCMRFYEHMQAPGIDILTEHQREYDTAKQVSSAARQFGRKWRITETYGCTGWDFSFAGHKAIGDWQAALGINLRCQHLSLYTMEGEAKRDYPASIFYQSPWWMFYSKVEDYFARIHAVMTQGEEVRDLLVIHPVESMWMLCRKDWKRDPEVSRYDKMLIELRDSLLEGGIDFDYGDEDILSRHGKVETGNSAPLLVVGKARYKAVIVPPLKTVRHSTLSLLKKFRSAGGTVVFAGQACGFVNALPSKEAIDFSKMCERAPAGGKGIVKPVEKTCRRVSITDSSGKAIRDSKQCISWGISALQSKARKSS